MPTDALSIWAITESIASSGLIASVTDFPTWTFQTSIAPGSLVIFTKPMTQSF
jgi:hypothetical protein